MQVSLVDMPDFSFDLDVLGGDVTLLPGLEAWLNSLIRSSVLMCALCGCPLHLCCRILPLSPCSSVFLPSWAPHQ